ncbi:MAG TPA: glycosyltransferase family 2 protein [Bacteroidia bacterium]|jgi:glycosyltransferase involved in cell wall biosynthesis|nr:glycosyltransferase family 2 protein [Sphingobacteriales bacterium]HPD65975.1 glycosyltransferase family 2 protein [Bacteroidia bacterium]HRS59604.1 glycosyltransferase family 2 protein [Bacteroidia bacterium]HRU68867.1 glycosyltransferase family 2 protein [Bacteroidia bacterium]
MLNHQKIIVVLPAFNAEKTLVSTFSEIPFPLVDEVVLVDDKSTDQTISIARKLGIRHIIEHQKNLGYGGNQKSCYKKALELGGDIIIMLHPDYQYTPRLIPAMAEILSSGLYKVVYASRILGRGALKGGMPLYKYIANRILTLFQNLMTGAKLSEYHTGYRAFCREVFEKIDFQKNSDDFIFDNELTAQILYSGYEIAEITCPTRYFKEASSINFRRSLIYGLGVIKISILYFLQKRLGFSFSLFRRTNQ